jgi:hypothetical protein
MSGNMLGSFVTESNNARGLLNTIREKAPAMFAKITENNKGVAIAPPKSANLPASIPANVPAEQKKGHGPLWVAIGLDVLGAAAIGLGIYNNAKAIGYQRDSEKIIEGTTSANAATNESEFNGKIEKMQSAEKARNIFYIAGGALLLGGIGVHIWF